MGRPPRRISGRAPAALLCLGVASAAAQTVPFPAAGVRVDIVLDSSGTAHIDERYALAPGSTLPSLQYLSARCASVEAVAFTLANGPLGFQEVARGPWVELRFAAPPQVTGGGVFLTVSYVARIHGRVASIPVLMPMAPLAAQSPARVTLTAPPDATVHPVLPHLTRDRPGTWTAEFRALPSFVRVDLGGAGAACDERRPAGNAGTFDLRFAIFIATLALWIPLYFWWARRQDHGA